MTTTRTLLATAAILGVSAALHARPYGEPMCPAAPPPPPEEAAPLILAEFDVDGDGCLNEQEFVEVLADMHARRLEKLAGRPRRGLRFGNPPRSLRRGIAPGGPRPDVRPRGPRPDAPPPGPLANPEEFAVDLLTDFDADGSGSLEKEELIEAFATLHERRLEERPKQRRRE